MSSAEQTSNHEHGSTLRPGQQLGAYKIIQHLGSGGMGSVYKAMNTRANRVCALKILAGECAQNPQFTQRFIREAEVACKLRHPHIVSAYRAGRIGAMYFMEMEYVDGMTLEQVIENGQKLTVRQATGTIRRTAAALVAAHDMHIVHRDIKPANIMLARDYAVKVMDFGLAKNTEAESNLTMFGQILGTPFYISPEQCNCEPLDGRTDIYALGLCYYFTLAGQPPFVGSKPSEVILKQLTEPLPNIRKVRPDVPDVVVAIMNKMTAKKRDERYRTAQEVIDALLSIRPATATVVTNTESKGEDSGSAVKIVRRLVCIDGPLREKAYTVSEHPQTFGRDSSSDIFVSDQQMSRRHAEVRLVDGLVRLKDLGSTNGTIVNGQRVKEAALKEGDRIQIGSSVFVLQTVKAK